MKSKHDQANEYAEGTRLAGSAFVSLKYQAFLAGWEAALRTRNARAVKRNGGRPTRERLPYWNGA